MCTIGGNVAENSGGAHCFKYGFTTNYVSGLEVVLPDGSVVQLGGPELDHPGYDLVGAFVGSEGTLGIATKIWLRVIPKPEAWRTLVAFFGSTVQAGEVVSRIVAEGIVPGAIEMMDNLVDPRRRGRHERRLSRRTPARRSSWSSTAPRPSARRASSTSKELCARRRQRARGAGRGGARPDLAGAQGRVRRDGPDRAELLRAGQRDPAHAAGRRARPDRASWRRITTSRWRTSSTPATATCTRSSVTTGRSPARPSAPRSSPG